MSFLNTVFYFIVSIGVLVAVHEFGHFWVARRVGVKVLRFSIGFGHVLWRYQAHPQATEYVLSLVPLGGYVKMVDEREGEVSAEDLPAAFNRKPLLARTAVVAAGPVFNLVLAVALFWSVLVIGEMGIKPILGAPAPHSIADNAGFLEGDEILSVNEEVTPTWTQAMSSIMSSALEGESDIHVKIKNAQMYESTKTLHIQSSDTQNPDALYAALGMKLYSPALPAIIGKILDNGTAKVAGLQAGDVILRVGDTPVTQWQQWVDMVKANPNNALQIRIERDGVESTLTLTPNAEGKIGAAVHVPEQLIKAFQVHYALSPLDAMPAALRVTYHYATSTVKMMGQMFAGRASLENLSGPISIAQYAGQSAEMGLVHFLKFMGLISVSLGVLNLLPIPVLDGGHLFFFAIEGLKGSPVSENIQLFFQKMGLFLLGLLMATAMFMDVGRLFH
ncbi:MAG TPA: RIP metalloprotease RseP [Methylococcaceae bacterium]|nr:RIP metalloprotease RseP [Methylococcaceae bacterium]